MAERENVKTVRLSDAEVTFLAAIEAEDGVSGSDVLRRLLDAERRRRSGARTWVMRDLAVAVQDTSRAGIEDVMLRRLAREAEERFEAPTSIEVRERRSDRSVKNGVRGTCVAALFWFKTITLQHGNGSPGVWVTVARYDDDRFYVGVGARHSDDGPGRVIDFSVDGETPPEVFRVLFECVLLSAANKGVPIT